LKIKYRYIYTYIQFSIYKYKSIHETFKNVFILLISNFRRVLNVVCFLLYNFSASKFYMPTFQNTLSVLSSQAGRCKEFFTPTCLWRWNRQSVPKRQRMKFRRRGITQKKAYNVFILICYAVLILILLTWRIWWATNNTSRCEMGFNSAFKGSKCFFLWSRGCQAHNYTR